MTSCDVLVVGYGPVGMVAAGLLAQAGVDVAVVERWPERYSLSRAGHLDGETMRTFQHLQVADDIELVVRPMLQWSLMSADMEELATVVMGEDDNGWRADYLSYQPDVEAVLDARVRSLGVTVHTGSTVTAVTQDADGVTVTADGAGPSSLRARYVIGADGARSFVRQSQGISRQDLGFPALDQLVVDVEYHDPDQHLPQLPEVYQVLDPERPLLAGRWSGPRHSRFEFAGNPGETSEELADEARCWQLLDHWGITPDIARIDRRAVYTFESTLATSWRRDRVLLAGDAAHTMPQFMGQGMCSGIRDAANLAWKLAAVVRDDAAPDLLDTYETERRPHVREMIELSMGFGAVVLERDPAAASARDDALRAGNVPTPPMFPRLGPGALAADDDPVVGRPAPQARVADGRRVARFDDLVPGWALVSRHALRGETLAEHRALIDALPLTVAHVSRAPQTEPGDGTRRFADLDGSYDRWFLDHDVRAFVQRPDGYLFGTAATVGDVSALLASLTTALRRHGFSPAAAVTSGVPA